MQKYGLDRPSEEMQETSTFSRAAVTGTDKDKERKWQYIGKNMYYSNILYFEYFIFLLIYT